MTESGIYTMTNLKKYNNEIVFVSGVSASGKDYLLEKAKKRFAPGTNVFSLGALIHADMRDRYPGQYEASDSLKPVSLEELRISTHNAFNSLLDYDGISVINGHIAYRRQESIVIDPDMNMQLMPRDYIFVKSDPEEILKRRIFNERDRVIESVDTIYIQQEIARVAITAIADCIGARVHVISNNDESEKNADTIVDIVNSR